MNSRYNYMEEGVVADEESGNFYPDPLSLNYLNFKMTSVPQRDVLTDAKIPFLWVDMENFYGSPEWDDIILTLNGVSHKNFLMPEDVLYLPSLDDIKTSFVKNEEVN